MRIYFQLLILISFIAILSTSFYAEAARSCRAVLGAQTPKDVLDAAKLRQFKFKLDSENNLIDLTDNTFLGSISINTATHLYEWAPLDYQQTWVQNGGISMQNMREIYEEPAQALGRGYYVSTNPFDSSSYGDGLTVFKTRGPLVLISNGFIAKMNSPAFLDRLQKAGIDGFGNQRTWISLISVRHLKVETGSIDDPIWKDSNQIINFLSHLENIKKSGWVRQLPSYFPTTPARLKAFLKSMIDSYTQLDIIEHRRIKQILDSMTDEAKYNALDSLEQKSMTLMARVTEEKRQAFVQSILSTFDIGMILKFQEKGIDFNLNSSTPMLILAAQQGNANAVRTLIAREENLNAVTTDKGSTALMFAASEGRLDIVKMLVEAGCDINIKNNRAFTALGYAEHSNRREVINYLSEHSAL